MPDKATGAASPVAPPIHAAGIRDLDAIVRRYHEAQIITLDDPDRTGDVPILGVPEGITLKSVKPFLDEFAAAPERRTGTAVFTELASFIGHVKRFADADSAVFVSRDRTAPGALALLDYHRKGAAAPPRFGRHRSHYKPPLAEEWKAWTALSGKLMSQKDFAEFIEDRILDVRDATLLLSAPPAELTEAQRKVRELADLLQGSWAGPRELMALAKGLRVTQVDQIHEIVSLDDGAGTRLYQTEIRDEKGGQKIKVPNLFQICIPLFQQGDWYQVTVQLRYRTAGAGGIQWRYELYRTDAIVDHAITEMLTRIAEETGLDVFVGAPEA